MPKDDRLDAGCIDDQSSAGLFNRVQRRARITPVSVKKRSIIGSLQQPVLPTRAWSGTSGEGKVSAGWQKSGSR